MQIYKRKGSKFYYVTWYDRNGRRHRQSSGTDDRKLSRFITEILPDELPAARERFTAYKDLLERYATGEMPFPEFAARVRRREQGVDEDEDRERDDPF